MEIFKKIYLNNRFRFLCSSKHKLCDLDKLIPVGYVLRFKVKRGTVFIYIEHLMILFSVSQSGLICS